MIKDLVIFLFVLFSFFLVGIIGTILSPKQKGKARSKGHRICSYPNHTKNTAIAAKKYFEMEPEVEDVWVLQSGDSFTVFIRYKKVAINV